MAITQSTLPNVIYPPEKLVDGVIVDLTASKPISPTPLGLDALKGQGLVVRLEDLAAVPQSDATLQLTVDGSAYPNKGEIHLDELQTSRRERLSVTAGASLVLNWLAGAAAPANALQSSWGLWVWPPTTADRQLLGLTPTPEDARLAKLLPGGFLPSLFPDEVVRRLYRGGQTSLWADTINVAPSASVPVSQQQAGLIDLTPDTGTFWVLLGVAVDASVGGTRTLAEQLADALTINIVRDGGTPLLTLPAAAAVYGPSATGRVFGHRPVIVARERLRVYLTTQTALNDVPWRVVARQLVEQPIHRALWGLAGAPADLRDAVQSGGLVLPA